MTLLKTIAAALAASTIAGSAFAADLAPARVAYVEPAPVFTWTGFYLGVNGGWTWAGSKTSQFATAGAALVPLTPYGVSILNNLTALGNGSAPSPSSGFLGGAQIGYNWQFGPSFVGGLEADIQGSFNQDTNSVMSLAPTTIAGAPTVVKLAVTKSLDYFGTVRARTGFLVTPATLLYATGGLAYGGVKATGAVSSFGSIAVGIGAPYAAFSSGDYSALRVGWTAGAGVEYKFTPNLSAKLEYLYYDLGSARFSAGGRTSIELGLPFAAHASAVSTRFNGHIVRAGLNYQFGGVAAAPVVAKY